MNNFIAGSHVFFLTSQELLSLKQHPRTRFSYTTKLIFNPRDFFESDADSSEICEFFLTSTCKNGSKCSNYHPSTSTSTSTDCSLCNVKVKNSLRKFGLLSGCQCVFCYPCIRQWRSRGNVLSEIANSCPICGTISNDLLPLSILPGNFSDKFLIFQQLIRKEPI